MTFDGKTFRMMVTAALSVKENVIHPEPLMVTTPSRAKNYAEKKGFRFVLPKRGFEDVFRNMYEKIFEAQEHELTAMARDTRCILSSTLAEARLKGAAGRRSGMYADAPESSAGNTSPDGFSAVNSISKWSSTPKIDVSQYVLRSMRDNQDVMCVVFENVRDLPSSCEFRALRKAVVRSLTTLQVNPCARMYGSNCRYFAGPSL